MQVQVHCRNNIPCLHKFSLFLFAKENAANSARNVRKVTLHTRNRVRRKCENSPIYLKYRKRFARKKKKKKSEIDMTYAEEDGAEETRRRETSGAFWNGTRFVTLACAPRTCVVRKCSRPRGTETAAEGGRRGRERGRPRETRRAFDVVVSASRETLAARRALPFSRDVVADRRRCGPIVRCHRPRRKRESARRRVEHAKGRGRFHTGVKKKKRLKVRTKFDKRLDPGPTNRGKNCHDPIVTVTLR